MRLGIHRPYPVGQSYGGSVALAWALYAPLKPRALVLVSSPSLPWPGKLDPWYRLTNTWVGPGRGHPPGGGLCARTLCRCHDHRHLRARPGTCGLSRPMSAPPCRCAGIPADQHRPGERPARPDRGDMAALYPTLTLPVELIHGDADTIVPLTIHSQPLSRILPDARLTVLPGTGHMPHHAHPRWFWTPLPAPPYAANCVKRPIRHTDRKDRRAPMDLPFDGAISRYFKTEAAPKDVRKAIEKARQGRDHVAELPLPRRDEAKRTMRRRWRRCRSSLSACRPTSKPPASGSSWCSKAATPLAKAAASTRCAMNLNPRGANVVALAKPTERERARMVFPALCRLAAAAGRNQHL